MRRVPRLAAEAVKPKPKDLFSAGEEFATDALSEQMLRACEGEYEKAGAASPVDAVPGFQLQGSPVTSVAFVR
jgi:hypothetical protein